MLNFISRKEGAEKLWRQDENGKTRRPPYFGKLTVKKTIEYPGVNFVH